MQARQAEREQGIAYDTFYQKQHAIAKKEKRRAFGSQRIASRMQARAARTHQREEVISAAVTGLDPKHLSNLLSQTSHLSVNLSPRDPKNA